MKSKLTLQRHLGDMIRYIVITSPARRDKYYIWHIKFLSYVVGLKYLIFLFPIFIVAEPLKVVTINVWSGLDYIGSLKMGEYEPNEIREQRYQLLIDQLKSLDPDVIALNEANKLPHYGRRIARDLGYDMVFHVGLGGLRMGPLGLPLNLREGDVILVKKHLQLKNEGRKQLSGGHVGNFFTCHFADATQIVAASIIVNGKKIYIFNTHWHASKFANRETLIPLTDQYLEGSLDGEEFLKTIDEAVKGKIWRLDEAGKTVEFIDKIAGKNPVILMGDFNDLSHSEPIGLLLNAGFIDTYPAVNDDPGYSWDEYLNSNIQKHYLNDQPNEENIRRDRIDYIFSKGKSLKIIRSEIVFNTIEKGLHPSDHFGMMTDFDIQAE